MIPLRLARASLMAFVSSSSSSTCMTTTPIATSFALSSAAFRRTYSSSSTMLQASAAAPPPIQYVLRYSYVSDVLEKRGPHREQHLALAKELCLSGGPTAPLNDTDQAVVVPTGALFVFDTVESARSFVQQDPYVSAGIVTDHSIEAWTVAIQN